eukprot:gnl/TRDRNA2_/TRDRNA2_95019_c1_seq1.p1 gnl/TRDRNA2_/TRDRNA2_95019_c1~~gnl/TRDRNA2_/TRDRNA2_95019_c1_seq1.p1  ORF type:complete len:407 (+),score=116.03 gnl/TRDRNA2_/TRDRNA2_95019_c1_seq1:159-1223(+)
MATLNRHFRQFGEVVKLTVHPLEEKAFIQFAAQSAAEAAIQATPVLGHPEIAMAWVPKKGGPKGKGKKGGPGDRIIENRTYITNPEERARFDATRRQELELRSRKTALLTGLTDQLKVIMSKLKDENLDEAKRQSLKTMMKVIKDKMDAFSGAGGGGADDGQNPASGASPAPASRPSSLAMSPGASPGWKKVSNTLDLRPKVLRMKLDKGWTLERLKDELQKHKHGANDAVQDMQWELDGSGQPSQSVLVSFKERRNAEQIFNQRSVLPFYTEWCERAQAASPGPKVASDKTPATPAREQPADDVGASAVTATPSGGEEPAPAQAAPEAAATGAAEAAPAAFSVDLSDEEVVGT